MSAPDNGSADDAQERELRIKQQIAFAAGVFQEDITVRTLLEAAAEGVVIIDSYGIILLVNARTASMFGYEREELIGKPHSILIPQRLQEVHEEHQRRYFEKPVTRTMGQLFNLVAVRKDGSEFPVDISLGALDTTRGSLVFALVSDVTGRKQAERALKQAEELARIHVACMRDYAIFMLDTTGRIITWNAGAELLKGYSAEEIIGKHFSCLYSQEDRDTGRPDRNLREAELKGRAEDEGWRVRKDGSRFWANVILTALRDDDGSLRGFSKVTRDMTERKKAEDLLRLSESRYRALFTDNPTMIVTLDSDFRILSINPACCRQLGYDENELVGTSVVNLFHENDRDAVSEKISACLGNPETVFHWHFRKIRKDGAALWVEETARAISDLEGRVNVLIVCQDVTEREQLLWQLEAVLDSINEGVIISDLNGNIVRVNKAARSLHQHVAALGRAPTVSMLADVIQLRDMEGKVVPVEDWPLSRAIRGERFVDCEITASRRDTGEIYIESVSGGPVKNKDGEAILAVVTARNIAERKRMEEDLRIAKAQLETITDNMSIGVTKCSRNYRYLWVSSAYASWLGKKQEEIVGSAIADVIGDEAFTSMIPCMERVLTGERVETECRLNVTGLGVRWVESKLMPTYDPSGVTDGWIEVVWDVTSRKEMEEELQKSKEKALQDLRDKEQMLIQQGKMAAMGEMIGFIAHQWRQPLNMLGLIVQDIPLSNQQAPVTQQYLKDSAAKALSLIAHMSRTIDDFRNFFKEEKEKVPFQINDVIERALNLVMPRFEKQGAKVHLLADHELTVEGHANEFSQAILNLLINIIDVFAEREIERPEVTISIFREDGKSVITVSDNAGGIEPSIIDKIFDAYFTTKGAEKGTGLGLYMVKTIIEKNMGGRVAVRNTESGAEFRIEVAEYSTSRP